MNAETCARVVKGALALVAVAAVYGAMLAAQSDAKVLEGRLHEFVRRGDDLAAADLASAPEPLRRRLRMLMARRSAFKSRIPPMVNEDPDGKDGWASRRDVERAIVSIVAAQSVEAEAERFARDMPFWWEYEGQPEGPLAEAAFAENYLKRNPQTPLAPYLYLFIVRHQRIAFETYAQTPPPVPAARALEGMKATARKYRAFMQRARAHQDPLVVAIAEDIDRQPWIYVKTAHHPRDFDPDT